MASTSRTASRPNVLLVVLDTARADALEPYSSRADTPTVRQLASRGVAYPRAIAPSCWTVPSHAAMLLGGPPRSVGICHVFRGNGQLCVPVIERQRGRYLSEVLRRNGYETHGVSANAWISNANGFSTGFDAFHDLKGNRVSKMGHASLQMKLSWYIDALRAKVDDGATAVESLLRDWLAKRPRSPFFWFVNLVECHSPYLPPRPYNDAKVLDRLRAARDNSHLTLIGVMSIIATGQTPSPRALARMRYLYDRSVTFMDAWLARIMQALDRSGVLEETIVIVTSDHGENFGEGGLIAHGGSLDDRMLWVPLVVAGAGVGPSAPPLMSLNRLPQMIGDLVGIDHPWQERDDDGIAIAQYDGPVLLGDPSASFLDGLQTTPDRIRRLTQRHTCATDGKLKLVRSQEGTTVYDLEADLMEIDPQPIGRYPAERIAPLQQALDKAQGEERDETVEGEAPNMTADLEERMRLLGYL
jgi:arylsulfatase A-like enzyme